MLSIFGLTIDFDERLREHVDLIWTSTDCHRLSILSFLRGPIQSINNKVLEYQSQQDKRIKISRSELRSLLLLTVLHFYPSKLWLSANSVLGLSVVRGKQQKSDWGLLLSAEGDVVVVVVILTVVTSVAIRWTSSTSGGSFIWKQGN